MTIKIQGNKVMENDIHHWILVSDVDKGWVDIPFTIDTPKFETLQKLIDYLGDKEELITECIQGKLNNGIELKHPDEITVDRPSLINDKNLYEEIKKEKMIKDKVREIAIKELKRERKL